MAEILCRSKTEEQIVWFLEIFLTHIEFLFILTHIELLSSLWVVLDHTFPNIDGSIFQSNISSLESCSMILHSEYLLY